MVESKTVEVRPLEASSARPEESETPDARAAGLLAVVADPVRWRLLRHLAGGQPTCVCELQPVAAVAGNLLSYHLRVLRESGLVTAARRGRWVDYTIAGDALDRLHAAIPVGLASGVDPSATCAGSACAAPGARR